jgi:hypothetical protein
MGDAICTGKRSLLPFANEASAGIPKLTSGYPGSAKQAIEIKALGRWARVILRRSPTLSRPDGSGLWRSLVSALDWGSGSCRVCLCRCMSVCTADLGRWRARPSPNDRL